MSDIYILGIESSCDDTSAAVLRNGVLLSNVTASQEVHRAYGGVVPELASRAHQQNIVPVVDQALHRAGITKEQLSAIAFTRGPGLMGSLLVGVNFAKGLSRALDIPLIDVNHLQGHVMAHFIKESDDDTSCPPLPFLCLLVSGGNSQIVLVRAYNDMEVLGQTIDDAAGEAIDKCSKVMGLGYPGGPIIDRLARQGNPKAYQFSEPHIPGLDYSFSGLKTSFLYNLRKWIEDEPDFVENHKEDIDYINAHATSTRQGDMYEAIALDRMFNGRHALISSTKGMTGHECWMAGASEIVYSTLMMQNNFVAPNVNFENPDEYSEKLNIATKTVDTEINTVLSNSFGFGGTNSALVIRKFKE